jgi:gas vesicle protein
MASENYDTQEIQTHNGHALAVFRGVLLGGFAGAITALLLAPQSGKETRNQIQNKVTDIRNRASDKVEGTLELVRDKAGQIKSSVGDKARDLKVQGQDVLVEQLDRVSAAAEARKKDIQANRGQAAR